LHLERLPLGCSARTLWPRLPGRHGPHANDLIDDRVALGAKRLLARTDRPADAIGRLLGFGEATRFGQFFVRHVGVTSGEFRALPIPAEGPDDWRPRHDLAPST
jgi:AraC-like DNA-binding protein